jgi:hypothetical protein
MSCALPDVAAKTNLKNRFSRHSTDGWANKKGGMQSRLDFA